MLPPRIQSKRNIALVALGCLLSISRSGLAQSNVVAWGNSNYEKTIVPAGLTNAVAVTAGFSHSVALRSDGTVMVWGDYQYGQANVPSSLTNAVAISAPPGGFYTMALRTDRHMVAWPANSPSALNLPSNLTNAAAIAAGTDHSLALRTDGTVTAWGQNYFGQLNVPDDLSNVVAVVAGQWHSLALKADGTVAAWGESSSGQLSVPADLTNAVAVAAGGFQSAALRADGTVVAWGETAAVPADLTNVVAIAAGDDHVLALKADGTVTVWGLVLGDATAVPAGLSNVVTIAAGGYHNLAVVGSGPPFMVAPLVNRSTYWGSSAYFRVAVSGAWPLSYQWQLNGTNLSGANNSVLVLTNAQLAQSGTYTVIVSNALGVASSGAVLTVIPQSARILADSLGFTNGHFQFNATGYPPRTLWTMQASTNLVDWVDVYTLRSYGDTMTYTDPSTNFSRRFYRLRLKP